jgi:hypothetical protein
MVYSPVGDGWFAFDDLRFTGSVHNSTLYIHLADQPFEFVGCSLKHSLQNYQGPFTIISKFSALSGPVFIF